MLTPADPPVVRWGAEHVDGTWRAAPSQLVLDSLTGNGRMPAEGEAVLEWMADNEAEWRAGSLDELVAGRYFRG